MIIPQRLCQYITKRLALFKKKRQYFEDEYDTEEYFKKGRYLPFRVGSMIDSDTGKGTDKYILL